MRPQPRTYRSIVRSGHLTPFRVKVKETDLLVHAPRAMAGTVRNLIITHRGYIETFIAEHPSFATTLSPWQRRDPAPEIVRKMVWAGRIAGVGPMAAVAGALAEAVGNDLLTQIDEVMVENGGDVFIKTSEPVTVGIGAGRSPLSLKIGLRIDSADRPAAVCTSSGTVGHSLSLGTADGVCVVADSCALADAAATALGNRVQRREDLQQSVEAAKKIPGIKGVVAIKSGGIGMWGDLEVVPLAGKKG